MAFSLIDILMVPTRYSHPLRDFGFGFLALTSLTLAESFLQAIGPHKLAILRRDIVLLLHFAGLRLLRPTAPPRC